MTLVVVTAAAREEMFAASDYLDAEEQGKGDRFLDEVDRALDRIAENPYVGPRTKYRARRVLLHSFPYSVVYRLHPDHALVIAIAHFKRKLYYWRDRK